MPKKDQEQTQNQAQSQEENKYRAARGDKQAERDSSKKAAGVAAKGAINAFTGGAGGKVYDAAKKIPGVGKKLDKAEQKLGDAANKLTGGKFGKMAKKADDAGALDAADKAVSLGGGSGGGATPTGEMSSSSQASAPNQSGTTGMNPLNISQGPNKKGGLGKPSSLDEIDSKEDSDEPASEKNSSFLGNFSGMGLMTTKSKIIMFGIPVIIFLFAGFILLSAIGSADEDDAENGKGNPDREGAKGTKYESEITGNTTTSIGGTCTYDIKGSTNGQTSKNFNQQISDLKVRLMFSSSNFCDGSDGQAMNEELVDFETYILGVVYAEIAGGSNEAHAKTQAVAARSFILDRAIRFNTTGDRLVNENGQWILEVRNCVADQVYCNPDKGCSKKQLKNQNGSIYSGTNNPLTYKGPMSQNAKARQWVAETAGQLLVNQKGYIVGTDYASTRQDTWRTLGESLDYKQILLQTYGSNKEIYTSNCTGGQTSTGDYTSWKQYGASWSSIRLGSSSATIQSAGCLATSISILIAKSGVATSVSGDFNPGTFVQKMSSSGGFDGNGNLQWNTVSRVAPSFVYQNSQRIINNSKSDKLNRIKELLNDGNFVVAEVKGNTGQHWVAIDSVNGDTINMMDPGSTATNMWSEYNWKNTSRLVWFKAG